MAGGSPTYDEKRTGILQTTGSFKTIQWTDGDKSTQSNRYEILDSSRNLTNITSLSASGHVSASSFEVDGQASISYDASALDFSNGGAGAKLSTSAFSASVELQGASLYTAGVANLSGGLSASSARVADLSENRIVFAGAGGELQDSAEFKFQSNTLTVSGSTFSRDVVIAGDLTVAGTTTTVQSTEVTIADKALVVASGSNDAQIAAAGGAGLKVGSEDGQSFLYDGTDSWDSSENMNLASGKSFNISDTDMLNISGAAKVRSNVAGDGLGHSAGVLSVNVDDSSIETNADTLRVKALGVTNAMLAGNIASTKIAELNNFDTADLAEGTNLYYTDARARAAVSVTQSSGDGSISYDSSTGVITYTGPSASETRAHFSSGYMIDYSAGQFSIDSNEFSSSFTNALSYNASGVRAHLSSGYMIDYSAGQFSIDSNEFSASWDAAMANDDTDSLAEGSSNLYFTEARARGAVSVTDNGGDGSLSYDSGSGVITYTGPSAAETRAHFSGAAGIELSGGAIAVNVDDAGIEINADALRLKSTAMAGTADEVEVSYSNGQFTIGLPDDVTVSGAFYANSGDFTDSISVALGQLSVDSSNFSVGSGMTVEFESALTVNAGMFLSSSLNMNSSSINNLANPSNAQDAATKAYVDAQLTSQDLDMASDSGSGSIDLDSQTLTIGGTANEIETSFSGTTLTVGLPDSVTITTNLTVGSNAVVSGTLNVDGNATLNANVDLGDSSADTISMIGSIDTKLMPSTNGTLDMGDDTNRWGDIYATNMYTGDLHMKNERGDWTLFEESDHIRIRNNATGQEFKLNMTPVEE
jgi:hypothetical protein